MKPKLFTIEFISLNIVCFFAFCNLSIFYGFYSYLNSIGIPLVWQGILVGLEPMTSFMLRPFISLFLHAGNSIKIILISLVMIMISLVSYQWTQTILSLAILRIFHGSAFVLLVSASMAIMVNFIPKERSAEGYGLISLTTIVPYAVMPLLTEFMLKYVKNEAHIYAWVSIITVPAFFLLVSMRRRIHETLKSNPEALIKRFSLKAVKENLRNHEIIGLLNVNLLLFLSNSIVFFFIKNLSTHIGIKATGSFFTVSTIAMILVRLFAGKHLDKIDKLKVMKSFMLILAISLLLVSHISAYYLFILFSACYGFSMGIITPLLNSALFSISSPQYRGINTNLSLFMMDAGFFLAPYLGGIFLSKGFSVVFLFYLASLLMMLAILSLRIRRKI